MGYEVFHQSRRPGSFSITELQGWKDLSLSAQVSSVNQDERTLKNILRGVC